MASGGQGGIGHDLVNVGTLEPEKLHRTVLNRCLPHLLMDLDVNVVMMYIQQKELFDAVTIRDINEQTTTTYKISHLIDQIKKRDQNTYVRFKECLILAQRADLKIMLEEEEENLVAEMKEKYRVAEDSKVKSPKQAGAKKELDEPQTKGHDPDAPITREHMNYAHLCIAIVTVCENAMREILSTHVPSPHTDIHQAILANKVKLTSRQGRPLLNSDQIQLVFPDPQGKTTGKVDQLGLSLLYILIRNISTVPAPVTGWGYDPQDQPRDISLGASVERIRSYRNHIIGHPSSGKISQQDFEDYWAKIDEVLREIEIVIGNHGYLEDLEKLKNQAFITYEAHELQKKFQEYKRQTEGTGIPVEILNMDDRAIQLFENALNDGKEKVCSIRVMVVGHQGVGKTTLIKRLLGENVDMSVTDSTEGIDVHLHCCDVSLPGHEWTLRKEVSEQDYRLQRLAKVIIEKQQVRSEAADAKQVVIPQEGEITDISAQELVSHPVVMKNHPKSNANTVVRSEPKVNVSSESRMKDPYREMLQLLQKNAAEIKHLGKYAPLTMWDFAGQYAFYTTHQMFLSRRAIYLLVSNISKHLDDKVDDESYVDKKGKMECRVRELLDVWMNSIHSCAPSDEESMNYNTPDDNDIPPPVILVGTHADAIPQDNRHEICENYFSEIRSYLEDKPSMFHLVEEDFAIDNTVVDSKLEGLKRKIVEVASRQSYWREEIPARWLSLEQVLMNLRAQGYKVIDRSLLENINQAGVQISTDELDLFLRFQNEIGTILYFSTDLLKEKIVLEPQWMIKALKSLITTQKLFVQRHAKSVISKWNEFHNDGKLTPELIDALWTKDKNPDLHDNKDHILLLMEQLNIIAKPIFYIDDELKIREEDFYLAPCMLRQSTPKGVICPKSDPENESTSVLCFVCKGKFLPTPIFHRLVGACLRRWPIAKKRSENQIYCGCCVFHLDHHHTLTLHLFDHVIFARAIGMGVTDTRQSSKLCTEARKFIFESLLKITNNLGQSLQFEMHIQCPNCDADSTEGLFAVPLLQKHEKVVCYSHDEWHTLVSQKLLRLWFEDGTVMEGIEEGKESKVLKKEEDASMDRVSSTSIKKGVPCSNPFLLCQLLQKSQQAASSSQSTLEANCLSVGLEFHGATPADGNCFFEAVSSQLRRLNGVVQKSPQQLRQEVVTFMRTNRVIQVSEGTLHLDSFIYNESFDVYCSRMARDGEWADHVVVVAMARMLQIDIMIVTSSPLSGPEDIIVWVVGQTAFQEDPILLGHIWESHYMSLQPISVDASNTKMPMQAGAKKDMDEPKTKVKNIDGQDKDDVDTPITQEHINHARLCNALTTVCSNALREILLTNVPKPHPDIYKAILANKAKLNKLNKEQARLVFPDPRGSSTGKVEEFDISLLYTIIRNVSSVPAPSNGWGNPTADNPRDTALGANVERIRSYRNHIVGHDVHGKICQQEFEDYWAKIDKVLREIEIVIGNHGYLEDLEKRKNQAITPHEAHELQKKFQKYRKRKEAAASAIESAAETLMSEVKKFRCNRK